MSVDLPPEGTSNPPRVESSRWRRIAPYLVLVSVVVVVVAFSSVTPEPVAEIPIPRPPALDESDGQKIRAGFWAVTEMWIGSTLEYSEQEEEDEFRRQKKLQLEPNESSLPLECLEVTARISPKRTFEISRRSFVIETVTGNRTGKDTSQRTIMVFATRFDPDGMGTIDALPIAWNEEIEGVLENLDGSEALKGLYVINGNTMQVYLPGDTSSFRPRSIPKHLRPADRLFRLRRRSEGERSYVKYYPLDWPQKFDGTIQKINTDGTVEFRSFDGNDCIMRVEQLPHPLTTPIEQAVDPPRSKRTFTFCHTNGWILQTEEEENPPPIPPLPSNAPPPVIQWIRKQLQKLP